MRNEAVGVVWGLAYVKRSYLVRLGARLHDLGVFASSWGLVTRNEATYIVWGLVYAK